MQGPEGMIELFHGYTYSGHPAGCAAGLAVLDIYEREGLLTRAADLAPVWEDALHDLRGVQHVIDIRNMGLVGGIELAARDGAVGARGYGVFTACWEAGVLIRVTGDIIALSPPLIISEDQISQIMDTLRAALAQVA